MRSKQAFSLMEIVVSLIILAIVTAMILPKLNVSMEQTKAQAAKNNLLSIAAAQARFNEDYSPKCANASISPCYCVNSGTNPTGLTSLCADAVASTADINTNLRLSIPSNDPFTYACSSSSVSCSILGATACTGAYCCIACDNTDALVLNVTAAGSTVTCPVGGTSCPN